MGDATGDRLRGVVLAGAALLVLVAGGWWWRANAPVTGADRADGRDSGAFLEPGIRPPRGTIPFRGSELDRAVVTSRPDASTHLELDVRTGRALDLTELPDDWSDGGLPRSADVRWREEMTLVPGAEPVRRESRADGVRRLLQYRCTGDGELLISTVHAPYTDTSQTNCDGEPGWLELPEPQVPTRLEFSAVAGPVRVQAQVVALS
ncbi:hypothetical protein [Micromonospora sp. CPCC 205556]|uniref:hypothetical protein n=1 Tax=Micromonospora sp. CPCC 205556 TaxID=3122398 RepID=UPI002FF1E485